MLALLHVVVQSYSLGSTLPARTRATRCSSARCLSEGQDYMLQELNPAKAGILCGPPSPRTTLATLAAVVAAPVGLSLAELPMPKPQHITRSSATAHCQLLATAPAHRSRANRTRSPLTAHQARGAPAQDPHSGLTRSRRAPPVRPRRRLPRSSRPANPNPNPNPNQGQQMGQLKGSHGGATRLVGLRLPLCPGRKEWLTRTKHEPNPHRNVRPNPEPNPNQPGTEAPTLTLTLTLTLTTPAWAASELPGLLRARPDGDFLQAGLG